MDRRRGREGWNKIITGRRKNKRVIFQIWSTLNSRPKQVYKKKKCLFIFFFLSFFALPSYQRKKRKKKERRKDLLILSTKQFINTPACLTHVQQVHSVTLIFFNNISRGYTGSL